jgi:alpha-tubulin suppressor-like RCC1 family protein
VTYHTAPVQVTALGSSVVGVATGTSHTCARKSDGTLWCWGSNFTGQIGSGATIHPQPSPVQVADLGANVTTVAAGDGHTCAHKSDGTLWCWGSNSNGQVGQGASTRQYSPLQVTALGTNVVAVAAGGLHTCVRKSDDTLWCYGGNTYGQLGIGTTLSSSPVQVAALGTNVAEVVTAYQYTCARKGDGSLWCWGLNSSGQTGDGTAAGTSCDGGTRVCRLSPVAVALPCP